MTALKTRSHIAPLGAALCLALVSLAAAAPAPAPPVNVNTGSQQQLEALPGVGPVYAKKIIANRPYAAIAELAKAGVPSKTIQQITPLVTVGSKAAQPAAGSQTPPAPGMVWANPDTKLFHRQGDRWYGKTRNGSWM